MKMHYPNANGEYFFFLSNMGVLEALYLQCLSLPRAVVWIGLVACTAIVHVIVVYGIEKVIGQTEVVRVVQALVVYWGGVALLASAHAAQITSVEFQHERVTKSVNNASHLLALLHRRIGGAGVEAFYKDTWLPVLLGSTAKKVDRTGAVERLKSRELESNSLEIELEKNLGWSRNSLQTTHDIYLQVLSALQDFRTQAFVNIESSNVMRLVLVSTVFSGLPALLGALDFVDDANRISPTGGGYWITSMVIGMLSAASSIFLIHGRFGLRFYGARYHAQATQVYQDHIQAKDEDDEQRKGSSVGMRSFVSYRQQMHT
jgi:hypothetical protein